MSHVSESTIRRLSHYFRVLEEARADDRRMISSRRLAEHEGITPAQVRKDLSCFGSFGRRGLGYNVDHLLREIRVILGLDRRWRMVLVGAGNIGSALLAYRGFEQQGFDVVAVYDQDPVTIGRHVGKRVVEDVARLPSAPDFDIGVIATPVAGAQQVAEALVAAGARGILNFAPRKLRVPAAVALRSVDLTVELESLSYALARTESRPRRRRR